MHLWWEDLRRGTELFFVASSPQGHILLSWVFHSEPWSEVGSAGLLHREVALFSSGITKYFEERYLEAV